MGRDIAWVWDSEHGFLTAIEWIPVEEQRPPEGRFILVQKVDHTVEKVRYRGEPTGDDPGITHWTELPTPPQPEEDDA